MQTPRRACDHGFPHDSPPCVFQGILLSCLFLLLSSSFRCRASFLPTLLLHFKINFVSCILCFIQFFVQNENLGYNSRKRQATQNWIMLNERAAFRRSSLLREDIRRWAIESSPVGKEMFTIPCEWATKGNSEGLSGWPGRARANPRPKEWLCQWRAAQRGWEVGVGKLLVLNLCNNLTWENCKVFLPN